MRKFKKLFLISISFFTIFLNIGKMQAVTAYPYPVNFKQVDGSSLTVLIKGDEFLNWKETVDGYTLLHNKSGMLEYAILDNQTNLTPSGIIAVDIDKRDAKQLLFLSRTPKKLFFNKAQISISKQLRAIRDSEMVKMQKAPGSTVSTETSSASNAFPTIGSRKLICILMGFADKPFTLKTTDVDNRSDFNNLFNQVNYTAYGATGSVKDYYLENSYNQFNLTVDIAGPYTAINNMAYYGNNTNGNARALVTEAVNAANANVNFADYDNDASGDVDGVYVIFAGYGEEAGGGSNPDAIWSHASGITPVTLDGKTVSRYSCSPELRGNSGTDITRIGVICHEFGHILGAPDYYDTNYDKTGDGQYDGTGSWDMMAGGNWNNAGATPAHHNAWTKVMFYNWASATTLNSPQTVTLSNAAENANSFYRVNTTTEGEYFFIENREKHKFDSYIPGSGMIIYHIHSGVLNVGNEINVTHPQRMYPIAQNATQDPTGLNTYGTINSATCAWTGTTGKTAFTDSSLPSSKSWIGNNSYKPITGISRNATAKTVSFTFMGGNSCTPPTTQATNMTATNIQENQLTLNWVRGNGNKVLVLARRKTAINTFPLNGSTFTANSIFGTGTLIDAGTYVVYDGTANSVIITELLKNSIYYFAVYEYNSADHCYLNPALSGNFTTTGCAACVPTSTTNYSYGIENVSFNTINNSSSGGTRYTDYSDIITQLTPGNSYNLAISNYSYSYTMYTKAWIDWNKDCSFQANEEYDFGSNTNDATVTKSILVPANAFSGFITMRVRSSINYIPTSCGNYDYSEAEDYTLKIVGACVAPTVPATNFSATGMQDEQITLNWTRGNGNKVLVVARAVSAVSDTPFGTGFTANAEFGQGTKIGTDNFIVYEGTANNVTMTGLVPAMTYYFAIYEINSPSNCLSTVLTGNASTPAGLTYCNPTDTKNISLGVTNVLFNTINNASTGVPAYTDYKSLKTTVERGLTYGMSVKINTSGPNLFYTKVWIDWNKNSTFDVPSEEYDLGTAQNVSNGLTSLSPINIAVPNDATLGITTIRIRTGFSSLPVSCGNHNYSEAEDYSIKVINNSGATDLNKFSNQLLYSVYTNIANQIVIENNDVLNVDAVVSIYNTIGEKLFVSKITDPIFTIKKDFQSGMLIVKINKSGKESIHKIFIR